MHSNRLFLLGLALGLATAAIAIRVGLTSAPTRAYSPPVPYPYANGLQTGP